MDKKYKWGIGIAVTTILAAAAYHFLGKKKGEPAPPESQGGGGGGAGFTAQQAPQVVQYAPPVQVLPIPVNYFVANRQRRTRPARNIPTPVVQNGQLTPVAGSTATIGANPNAPQLSQLMEADDGYRKDCMVTTF
jgi:hypothetical protein